MNNSTFADYRNSLQADAGATAALQLAVADSSPEELVATLTADAQERGFDVTREDVIEALRTESEMGGQAEELTDDELDQVAGAGLIRDIPLNPVSLFKKIFNIPS